MEKKYDVSYLINGELFQVAFIATPDYASDEIAFEVEDLKITTESGFGVTDSSVCTAVREAIQEDEEISRSFAKYVEEYTAEVVAERALETRACVGF